MSNNSQADSFWTLEQRRRFRTLVEPSKREEVAAAIELAISEPARIYIERRNEGWRWSFATVSTNDLHRQLGRYLDLSSSQIVIQLRAIGRHHDLVVWPDPGDLPDVLAWTITDLAAPLGPAEIRSLMQPLSAEAEEYPFEYWFEHCPRCAEPVTFSDILAFSSGGPGLLQFLCPYDGYYSVVSIGDPRRTVEFEGEASADPV